MANINDNLLVKNARGNVKKQLVYRKRGTNTHLVGMPVFDPNRPVTVEQAKVRNKFTDASHYAQSAIADPQLREIYAKKANANQSAFNVAFRDFSRKPVVSEINLQKYTGAVGSSIGIMAYDDVRVIKVEVRISTSDGDLLEEGTAILDAKTREWVYTATQEVMNLTGTVIMATAYDLPEHTGSMEVTI